ncbi:1-deoxy-D-xylulose-5-phosphate reductoisomerase [Pelagibacterales bacterium SAG-MED35]|nr:1-deoxy-D-xylulose-5-phosphate reductoisomerase [Pelagibacterales bacterium SAG-MED35]
MRKKVAILGSTGSIGKSLLNIIASDKNNFQIVLLTANKNHKLLFNQAKKFNVKNLIITNKKSYEILKAKLKKNKSINLFNNYNSFNKILKKKIYYTMSSISGINGLSPTLKIIKYTENIAIANKESIIIAWNLISKELKKNKTNFIPVDSEHFSIWYGLNNYESSNLDKIYLTASGGPFSNLALQKFKKIKLKQALNHPNWRMGKKISIDSATMINKIYEVIEAKNIFNINYKNIKILLHPNSYVHAILKFNNGLIKLIAHDTTMKIPIFNTLYLNQFKKIISKELNIGVLNNLKFNAPDVKRYPMIKLLKLLPVKNSLYETVIVSANDCLVELFLKEKIGFSNIQKELFKIIQSKEFVHYKKKVPKNLDDILNLNNYVRLKLLKKVYKLADVNTAF